MKIHSHAKWYDGEACDIQFFDPTSSSDPLAKQTIALANAFRKTTTKVSRQYSIACASGREAAKSGVYAFNIGFQFKKLKNQHAIVCEISWLLSVSSKNQGKIFKPTLAFTADWNALNRRWVEFLRPVRSSKRKCDIVNHSETNPKAPTRAQKNACLEAVDEVGANARSIGAKLRKSRSTLRGKRAGAVITRSNLGR